ncbi:MAG: hypothetical protein V4655_08120 [Bdellovibrionota bacterium]|nr:MAG: hypothetical protein EOP10_11540 [Pseudomonadota bacterium]
MSFDFYKVMHFFGLFMVFSALGGQIAIALNGGDSKQQPARKWIGIYHGLGLFIMLVAGFGMIAKASIGFPGWIIGKMAIWIILGGIGAVAARKKNLAGMVWTIVILLGLTAAYLAHYKPF